MGGLTEEWFCDTLEGVYGRKTQNTSIDDSLNLTQKSKLKRSVASRMYTTLFILLF